MRIKYFFILLLITLLTCSCSNPLYMNQKYGEMAIDNWFSDKELGNFRKKAENIDEIVSRKCNYVESKENKYVFKCKLTYKEKGKTVIPLSKNTSKNIYVVFIKNFGKTYSCKVYNSIYTKAKYKVWEKDSNLNY